MRILIFGAGAVGSVLGGLLARAGHQVWLLGRPDHIHAVRSAGLFIDGIWGAHHVPGLEGASAVDDLPPAEYDLILLTVKSYDTSIAIESLRRLAGSGAEIVSVQNGYGNTQELERAFGQGRVYGARIITGVELPAAGRVTVTVSADDIRIGPPAGERAMMSGAQRIAKLLRDAGIPACETDRYADYLWAKILYNCALNPLGALLRARYGELAGDAGTAQLIDRVIDEAFCVARSRGVPLFWNSSADYRRHFYDELIPPTAQHYPSMLRDLERRGRTEIDALNGAVAQLGDAAGIPTAANAALASMVKMRERTRRAELADGR